MVKAVAVLGSSEGVSGTIFFTQEGDGNLVNGFVYTVYVHFFSVLYLVQRVFRSNHCYGQCFWSQARASWIPCSRLRWHNQWLHVDWYRFRHLRSFIWPFYFEGTLMFVKKLNIDPFIYLNIKISQNIYRATFQPCWKATWCSRGREPPCRWFREHYRWWRWYISHSFTIRWICFILGVLCSISFLVNLLHYNGLRYIYKSMLFCVVLDFSFIFTQFDAGSHTLFKHCSIDLVVKC